MKILVINSGSSSLKYQLFDMTRGATLTAGSVARIGEARAALRHRWRAGDGPMDELTRDVTAPDHRAAFAAIGAALRETGVLGDLAHLDAIGHRVVHGGERFSAPARIDAAVVAAIRALIPLAPLHNPANLLGIELCLELFPAVPQVAVFDTAFHQTMPPHAYRYALPQALYAEHAVRRYGFHGTSHAYVARRTAQHLGAPLETINLITLHLGNGASAAAIQGGRCIDTSMGMTPLEGLVMGTRSGDLDPALAFYIGRVTGLDGQAVEALLNQESGLKGLCGVNDMRELLQRRDAGDAAARLAFEVYCYRVKKYIGAYSAVLGRVAAIVFTAGVGENAAAVRAAACAGLDVLGIRLDTARNAAVRGETATATSLSHGPRLGPIGETATATDLTSGRTSAASRAPDSSRGPADVQDARMPRRPGMAKSGLGPIGDVAEIHASDSAVKLLVVRTNEELEIAAQTRALLAAG